LQFGRGAGAAGFALGGSAGVEVRAGFAPAGRDGRGRASVGRGGAGASLDAGGDAGSSTETVTDAGAAAGAALTTRADSSLLASLFSAAERDPSIQADASAATSSAPIPPMTAKRRAFDALARLSSGLAAREPAKCVALDAGTAPGNSDPRG
jgi:hypothetical protein